MTHVVISNSMLAAAGGRLDPAYWLALKEMADHLGLPLIDDNIKQIVEYGEQTYHLHMRNARKLRDKANELLDLARAEEEQVWMLKQFTSKGSL